MGNEMNVTLYTSIGDYTRVSKAIMDVLSEVTRDVEREGNDVSESITYEDKYTFTFHDNTELKIFISHYDEFILKHLKGLAGVFSMAETDNNDLKENVIRQILVFNCVAGCVFKRDENEQRTNYILNSLLAAAKEVNGFLMFPDISLYNGNGELVLSVDGKSDLTKFMPIGNSDLLDNGVAESASDMQRRLRSISILKKRDIPYVEHLRAGVMEEKAELRTVEEIAERLGAMFSVCVYCEALNGGDSHDEALKYIDGMDTIFGGTLENYLTPCEKKFIAKEEPENQEIAEFGWRYEGCAVLMWALGYLKELSYPDSICDVSEMAKILWNMKSKKDLIKNSKFRSCQEILDEADLTLRYDWACVNARIHEKKVPAELSRDVVFERHYAFNWLIGANDRAKWDDIQPNT